MLCGAATAYGLTEGGYNAERISLTTVGRRIVMPTQEGDDARALREALLKPRIIREFLQRYDQAKIPRDDIARNVLFEMGVPRESIERTLKLILDGARLVGFVRELNGVAYIDLQGTRTDPPSTGARDDLGAEETSRSADESNGDEMASEILAPFVPVTVSAPEGPPKTDTRTRVFISHGKNKDIVDQIKTMFNIAEVDYEVAVESESTAIPVPEKIFEGMRNCNAAVICVTADQREEGAPAMINQNVLIEIGAAFVLYDKRVILLWDKRLPVPSNLQGLYRCEFQGSELSWSAGMKLMEAIKKFRPKS